MKVAIVTAAGKGIGAAIARELAARGYRVALMARTPAVRTLAQELGGVAIEGDVTDPERLAALVDLAVSGLGGIDVVVNNTGHPAKGPLLDISDDEWHQGLDLLLLNVVRMARLVTPHLKRRGGGAIVNVSTFAAFEPSLDFPVSSTLRAALGGFTKLYAESHAKYKIRMNNVLPSFTDSYAETEEIVRRIPAGRYAKVEEIAKVVAFLASEEASYVNGESVKADGGLSRGL